MTTHSPQTTDFYRSKHVYYLHWIHWLLAVFLQQRQHLTKHPIKVQHKILLLHQFISQPTPPESVCPRVRYECETVPIPFRQHSGLRPPECSSGSLMFSWRFFIFWWIRWFFHGTKWEPEQHGLGFDEPFVHHCAILHSCCCHSIQ